MREKSLRFIDHTYRSYLLKVQIQNIYYYAFRAISAGDGVGRTRRRRQTLYQRSMTSDYRRPIIRNLISPPKSLPPDVSFPLSFLDGRRRKENFIQLSATCGGGFFYCRGKRFRCWQRMVSARSCRYAPLLDND